MELVRISQEYIEQLRKVDYRVQSNAAEQGKDTKPFLGVLFTLESNGAKYFVPLSSPKAKHQNMPNSSDFHKVIDKKGRLRAVLNFNNMVPATTELCTRIDLHTDKNRFVLMDEYLFCRDNERMLKKKAQNFHSRYYKGELSESEQKRTCDFRKLEKELQKYLIEHHLIQKPNENESEQTYVETKSDEKSESSADFCATEERGSRAAEMSEKGIEAAKDRLKEMSPVYQLEVAAGGKESADAKFDKAFMSKAPKVHSSDRVQRSDKSRQRKRQIGKGKSNGKA